MYVKLQGPISVCVRNRQKSLYCKNIKNYYYYYYYKQVKNMPYLECIFVVQKMYLLGVPTTHIIHFWMEKEFIVIIRAM